MMREFPVRPDVTMSGYSLCREPYPICVMEPGLGGFSFCPKEGTQGRGADTTLEQVSLGHVIGTTLYFPLPGVKVIFEVQYKKTD